MSDLASVAAALHGEELRSGERLHGGSLSEVVRLVLGSGSTVVSKSGPAVLAEAAMLAAIACAGAPAPRVLSCSGEVLVLEDLGRDTGRGEAWADLGRVLRRLHSSAGKHYGWAGDHRFGPVSIPNCSTADWPEFWTERRQLAGIETLPVDLAHRIERLCRRLGDWLPEQPLPALLHGVLWIGDVRTDGARVGGLIDPACYHGHAEVDLAMLTLFGTTGPGVLGGDWGY